MHIQQPRNYPIYPFYDYNDFTTFVFYAGKTSATFFFWVEKHFTFAYDFWEWWPSRIIVVDWWDAKLIYFDPGASHILNQVVPIHNVAIYTLYFQPYDYPRYNHNAKTIALMEKPMSQLNFTLLERKASSPILGTHWNWSRTMFEMYFIISHLLRQPSRDMKPSFCLTALVLFVVSCAYESLIIAGLIAPSKPIEYHDVAELFGVFKKIVYLTDSSYLLHDYIEQEFKTWKIPDLFKAGFEVMHNPFSSDIRQHSAVLLNSSYRALVLQYASDSYIKATRLRFDQTERQGSYPCNMFYMSQRLLLFDYFFVPFYREVHSILTALKESGLTTFHDSLDGEKFVIHRELKIDRKIFIELENLVRFFSLLGIAIGTSILAFITELI
ncbi:hypothetical protein Fcan01_24434 [Folsomia candida]|uniref:Uncharacterized protein n=1 Tax=Folsomia candida TaxID=158441 RepID=A0A226D7D2_FOLCA|nr:hypothetical protein Fcan01_24434 [Folsomia candida]